MGTSLDVDIRTRFLRGTTYGTAARQCFAMLQFALEIHLLAQVIKLRGRTTRLQTPEFCFDPNHLPLPRMCGNGWLTAGEERTRLPGGRFALPPRTVIAVVCERP